MAEEQWSVKWPGGTALVWNPETESWEPGDASKPPAPEPDKEPKKGPEQKPAEPPAPPVAKPATPPAPRPAAQPAAPPPPKPAAKPAPPPPPARREAPASPRSKPKTDVLDAPPLVADEPERRSVVPVVAGGILTGLAIGYLISILIR